MWIHRLSALLIVAVVSLTLRSLLLPPLVQTLQSEKFDRMDQHPSSQAIEQQTSRLDD